MKKINPNKEDYPMLLDWDNYKNRGKGVYPSSVLFDLMNYSPIEREDVEEDCIIIKKKEI
jgi:hypothetical protein